MLFAAVASVGELWFKRACGLEGVLVIEILQHCWAGVDAGPFYTRFRV